jgi:hypothetical protein
MSQAEKFLTGASTAEALTAERAAVVALQRAFSRDRYILRAMATRSQLDATRRLTGSLSDATGWRRSRADAPANRRAALLQDLLHGIAELTTSSRGNGPRPGDGTRERAAALAEEAIRIDPVSASLRQAATELQRAAAATDAAARDKAIVAASAAARTEARRAEADAPIATRLIAPALSGAFADAMSAERKRP